MLLNALRFICAAFIFVAIVGALVLEPTADATAIDLLKVYGPLIALLAIGGIGWVKL